MPRLMVPILALAGAALSIDAGASPLAISPTSVEIAPGRRSAVIEVQNTDAEPVDLQFRVYTWDQTTGSDRLTPTTAIVVSPAIVTVPPGAKQLFRVLQLDGVGGAGTERSYRLRLNQIPRPVAQGVAINFEFLLPLFVGGDRQASDLRFAIRGGAVELTNSGGRHVRIRDLSLRLPDGTSRAVTGAHGGYVLANATMRWPLGGAAPVAGATLTAVTDKGSIDVAPAAVARAN